MRIISCLIAILLVQTTTAQQVSRKVNYSQNGEREVYYVLASDNATLHGRYQRIGKNERTEGFYNNGVMEGTWTVNAILPDRFMRAQGAYKSGYKTGLWAEYHSKKRLKSRGYYQNDQRVGLWRFFNEKGELEQMGNFDDGIRVGAWAFYNEQGTIEQEYDYTTNKVVRDISQQELSQQKFRIIDGADTAYALLERPPLHIGGRSKIVKNKYRYYRMEKDSIKVNVHFTIDPTGKTGNYRITDTIDRRFIMDAYSTVAQSSRHWLPAIHNGKAVTVEHTVTVVFKRRDVYNPPAFTSRQFLNSLAANDPSLPGTLRPRHNFTTYQRPPDLRTCVVSIL